MKNIINILKRNFIAGLGLILPLFITIFIIRWLYIKIDDWFMKPILPQLEPYFKFIWLKYIFSIFIFLFIIFVISMLGMLARFFIFRNFINYIEHLFFKLPFIGKIYKSIKQISLSLLEEKRGVFKSVVLVEYPYPEKYCIGFITAVSSKEIREKSGKELVGVFIPTTPNPTSGMLIYFPKDKIKHLEISVEEGLKLIVSGGIVSKDR
jgi:uncharacterized membrane protein